MAAKNGETVGAQAAADAAPKKKRETHVPMLESDFFDDEDEGGVSDAYPSEGERLYRGFALLHRGY